MPRFVYRVAVSPPRPDPRLERWLRTAVLAGLALVLLLPVARGHSQWLGWAPLWLVGMPLAAWWSLYRFRLPPLPAALAPSRPRRRQRAQARRRLRAA
ncbi:hypothetical protein [Pseudoxanthomonas wuyuanensis]|uniref:Transmembrane protein n=1 Tax=Pseudoxanthomonas wuyuanensis TaxID=1073196 RepID=A0A286D606_9GAMM|nr:hypothetical protein [Pseudoxanthomonas wuyuanensis]KAF1721564.1 hypothetical protein CSC75_07180 [Pseudoxanthomonas wuyuanensis]SOD54088.1 hypothetical protein SAMN06296416_10381 [Pseudoxanthomonas wuyuanensis]